MSPWPRLLPDHASIYHTYSHKENFNKPTYSKFRAYLRELLTLAGNNCVHRISTACFGLGFDQLDCDNFNVLFQVIFSTTVSQIVVHFLRTTGYRKRTAEGFSKVTTLVCSYRLQKLKSR